ncbi:MAG: Phosphate acetyltransferase [Chlamydiia bacterium]|nr:Phosphate acetyltransferase [Chlamydiia bacterium]MCH9615842.1 Phosphate acetyltransferase [Chlamydiia bacterium]MCH9628755.1 Phosphate acetyltransferase [Chlamydiia bacterium]
MGRKALFIASTGQHVGKTTTCLGLLSGLMKRHDAVGFMKPVGQRHVQVDENTSVDKDVILFKKRFNLDENYEDMSPVLIPQGFTRNFLDGKIDEKELIKSIKQSYKSISTKSDITVVEGTGHVGVGSIVNLSNARVASLLDLSMILIVSGGLGSAFDALTVNKALCDLHKVKISGVIINRVYPDKQEMVLTYMKKALSRWKIPILGCIPYDPFLANPTMRDFESLFGSKLLTGTSHRLRHFENIRLVATSLKNFTKLILPEQLLITPANREDIILATLTKHWDIKIKDPKKDLKTGLILIGDTPPKHTIISELKKADIPMLYTPVSSTKAMQMINSHTAKIQIEDAEKVNEAIDLVESHLNFDAILRTL